MPNVRKNTMPAIEMGIPTLPSSKTSERKQPRSSRAPLTTTLLAAPISVRLQPKLAAKDMGISWRDTEIPARWLTLITMGSSMATTATPLHTAEIMVATSMNAIIMPFSEVPVSLTRMSAIFAAMPVWNRVEPTTIIAAIKTMVLPENALNNCAGSIIPHNTKTLPPSMDTRAAGSFSVTKNTTITSRTNRVITAGLINVLLPLLLFWILGIHRHKVNIIGVSFVNQNLKDYMR